MSVKANCPPTKPKKEVELNRVRVFSLQCSLRTGVKKQAGNVNIEYGTISRFKRNIRICTGGVAMKILDSKDVHGAFFVSISQCVKSLLAKMSI